MFDLHDVGAEVAEHHRAVRTGEHSGEVDDLDAGEGTIRIRHWCATY
jgi:hypothetical protein